MFLHAARIEGSDHYALPECHPAWTLWTGLADSSEIESDKSSKSPGHGPKSVDPPSTGRSRRGGYAWSEGHSFVCNDPPAPAHGPSAACRGRSAGHRTQAPRSHAVSRWLTCRRGWASSPSVVVSLRPEALPPAGHHSVSRGRRHPLRRANASPMPWRSRQALQLPTRSGRWTDAVP